MLNIAGLELSFGASEPKGYSEGQHQAHVQRQIKEVQTHSVRPPSLCTIGKCVAEGEGKKNSHATSSATDMLFKLFTFMPPTIHEVLQSL
jgi:hypothetical protein